jgi:hypothetical protein
VVCDENGIGSGGENFGKTMRSSTATTCFITRPRAASTSPRGAPHRGTSLGSCVWGLSLLAVFVMPAIVSKGFIY